MIAEQGERDQGNFDTSNQNQAQEQDFDYIIEISILKIRRMQITGVRDERQRLLVLETLHHSIAKKIAAAQNDANAAALDNVTAFATILNEAIRRLGLTRIVRIGLDPPKYPADLPRLKLPSAGKKNRDIPLLASEMTELSSAILSE